MAQAAKDGADDALVVGTVHSGDAEAHGSDGLMRGQGVQDLVEHLLDLELAVGLEVRSDAPSLGDDGTRLVRQQPDGLGPAGVDPDHVTHQESLNDEKSKAVPARTGTGTRTRT
jgi:hypothetical protein